MSITKAGEFYLHCLISRLLLEKRCLAIKHEELKTILTKIHSEQTQHHLFPRFSMQNEFCEPTQFNKQWDSVFKLETSRFAVTAAQLLGSSYEGLLASAKSSEALSKPKKEGIFYTPQNVINLMLEEVLGTNYEQRLNTFKLLDPACGSGAFLVSAFERLCKNNDQRFCFRDRKKILADSIFGIDKDPAALALCKVALTLELYRDEACNSFEQIEDLFINLAERDFLINREPHTEDKKFDLIVGNPPYGLSRDGRLSIEENRRLKEIYNDLLSGKPNKYLLFLGRAIELLRDGGKLTFIIPNSWLGIDSGRALRELLLKEHLLSKIFTYDFPVFGDPKVETVSVVLEHGKKDSQFEVRHIISETMQVNKCFKLSDEECLKRNSATIPLVWETGIDKVFTQIEKNSYRLDSTHSPFTSRIALQAYAENKGTPAQSKEAGKMRIYDRDFKEDDSTFPYLNGRDIKRFSIKWSGKYLKYGAFLAEPQTLDRFQGPRILVREILGQGKYLFVAAYGDETMLYNKSVLHILPREQANAELMLALSAVLNSKLASFFLKFQGKKSQRKLFPKIVNADLKAFPVAKNLKTKSPELSQIAIELNRAISLCAEDAIITKLQNELDSKVYALYELSNSDVECIDINL